MASVGCAARAEGVAVDADALRGALAAFSGVKRRFEFYVNTPRQVYMDDYAHHPRELAATLTSVRKMFPGRRITALFQAHLYTRSRDLYEEFAESLSHADEVVLLPIYPAREEPIPGVTSELIARHVAVPCRIVGREALADTVGMGTPVRRHNGRRKKGNGINKARPRIDISLSYAQMLQKIYRQKRHAHGIACTGKKHAHP